MPQTIKKVPVRRCVGCMEHFEKKELIRVVRTPKKAAFAASIASSKR